MTEKILCVDDDENILAAYQRQLRKQFQIETAVGSEAGLRIISSGEPFAVVVSDLRMPGMDGIELLSRVREIAPDTVRIMLTGNADLQAAVEAVNQGNIFRFLTKPCPTETLAQAMQAGLRQYRLVTAERELLDQTLKGSVSVLTEILSILDSQSFGRACMLRDCVKEIAKELNITNTWDLELSAMLCQIGRITVPANTIAKEKTGAPLSPEEGEMLIRVPEIGHKLLAKIPRLESVAQTVLYQNKHFDGSGFPKDGMAGEKIPLGARIIKIVSDFKQLESEGMRPDAISEALKSRRVRYDPGILDRALQCLSRLAGRTKSVKKVICSVPVSGLEVGQMLLSDVVTDSGALLIAAGNRISESLLVRIRNFARVQGVRQPIRIEAVDPG